MSVYKYDVIVFVVFFCGPTASAKSTGLIVMAFFTKLVFHAKLDSQKVFLNKYFKNESHPPLAKNQPFYES